MKQLINLNRVYLLLLVLSLSGQTVYSYDFKSEKNCNETLSESSTKTFFFQSNIGVGLLYFSGVQGNLAGTNPAFFSTSTVNSPIKGSLKYNRTPLYEYLLGYQPLYYLRLGLSYQHQGNVTVQTSYIRKTSPNPPPVSMLTTNLELDSLMLKVYGESPWALNCKRFSFRPYLAASLGAGWQTWSNVEMLRLGLIVRGVRESGIQPVRQKINPTFCWGFDGGLSSRGVFEFGSIALLTGIKFNIWGQSGSIGRVQDQGNLTFGLFEPFSVKTVYQWAPYLGLEWCFPVQTCLKSKHASNLRFSSFIAKMNVGIGMLYFSGLRGNLLTQPDRNTFFSPNASQVWANAPIGNTLSYNRTPLMEYLFLGQLNSFIQMGLSYQNQGGVTIQSVPSNYSGPQNTGTYTQFTANLNLNSLMFKAYGFTPSFRLKNLCSLKPYLGLGIGPGWQSWSRITVLRTLLAQSNFAGGYQPVRQKVFANLTFTVDLGVNGKSLNPSSPLSVLIGCKFNYWGQTRGIGKLVDQDHYKVSLFKPVTIKTIYQWAPYLGVQWDFPSTYVSDKPYVLGNHSTSIFKPNLVKTSLIEYKRGFVSQFNVGLGLLYFNEIKGNLSEVPVDPFINLTRDVPIKGRLSYNRTPLFEYLLGYQFFRYFKTFFSYQHQGNISVTTRMLPTNSATVTVPPIGSVNTDEFSQLSADLLLDAWMIKVYFESPKGMLWLNFVTTPYLAVGGGVSMQTWKRVATNNPFLVARLFDSNTTPLQNKYCANGAFMWDMGLRMQSPLPNTGFSMTLGVKYNFWGQTRNIGNINQAPAPKFGIVEPFSIKTIYQFAPYLGLQWNF